MLRILKKTNKCNRPFYSCVQLCGSWKQARLEVTMLWDRPLCFFSFKCQLVSIRTISNEVCVKTRSPPASLPFIGQLQSWTRVLTHFSKTNAFSRRPSVLSKTSFLSIAKPSLSPFSMLQYAPWTLSPGYNIEKGRGGRNVKIREITGLTVFFVECLNCFCPWL